MESGEWAGWALEDEFAERAVPGEEEIDAEALEPGRWSSQAMDRGTCRA